MKQKPPIQILEYFNVLTHVGNNTCDVSPDFIFFLVFLPLLLLLLRQVYVIMLQKRSLNHTTTGANARLHFQRCKLKYLGKYESFDVNATHENCRAFKHMLFRVTNDLKKLLFASTFPVYFNLVCAVFMFFLSMHSSTFGLIMFILGLLHHRVFDSFSIKFTRHVFPQRASSIQSCQRSVTVSLILPVFRKLYSFAVAKVFFVRNFEYIVSSNTTESCMTKHRDSCLKILSK